MSTTDLSHYDKTTIPNASNMAFGIVVSKWNSDITENLYKGAIEVLTENGASPDNIYRMDVPGSFELIYGAKKMLESKPVDWLNCPAVPTAVDPLLDNKPVD